MSEPLSAEEFWRDRCLDCAHPQHEMTCHELVPNGDPSNGPAYCPCAVQIEWMEQEIVRLRAFAPVDRVGGEPDMTEQTVPNATTTRERLANLIAQFERGHHTADEMPDLILRTMTRDRAGGEGLDVERLRKAIDLSGLGLIEGSDPPAPASDFAPQIAREYAAHTDAVDCPTCGSKFNPGDFRYYAHTDADGAEKALRRLMQSADDYEREAKARHAWDEGGAVETVIAGIQQYRAVLADKGGER